MNWFILTLLAQFIAGSSLVFDKLIYKRLYQNHLGYTFWLGILGAFSLFLVPFGAHFVIPISTILIALAAGILFIGAMFFFFLAIFKGETSSEAIFIASFSPICTLTASYFLLGNSLDTLRMIAFVLLVIGGIILFLSKKSDIKLKTLGYSLLSAVFFGLSYTLTKITFIKTGFLTGLMWIKIGGVLAVLAMLIIPALRNKISAKQNNAKLEKPALYFLNRSYAGIGSIILYYATSLGPAPLVNATEPIKFIFVFMGGWLLLKERYGLLSMIGKIFAVIIIAMGITTLGTIENYASNLPYSSRPIVWGVTFSQKYAAAIGLDWKATYETMFNDFRPKAVRLVAYWDLIEPRPKQNNFSDLDYQIQLANEYNSKITLVVGQRVPRWPECHIPSWAYDLSPDERNRQLLSYIETVLNRYKNEKNLKYIQIENEPFLMFGDCPKLDTTALDSEISLAKKMLPEIPILVTDGGEFGTWYQSAMRSDVFGTTMYRRVHSETFGYFDYNLPPEFFRIKEAVIKLIAKKPNQKYIVAELAAEPWLTTYPTEASLEKQFRYFDVDFFKSTVSYAKLTGFDEYYLWGVEWWYWMKIKHNHPEFLDFAKSVLSQSK